MSSIIIKSTAIGLGVFSLALIGCNEETCYQTGCPTGEVCAATCPGVWESCSQSACVECGTDADCDLEEICRDNTCRASLLDVPCADLCATDECVLDTQCADSAMVCTDYDFGPTWGNCRTPCTENADCPGADDRSHWTRCLVCPDQPSYCTYNSAWCPGEEDEPGPSGSTPCDYSGCIQACSSAGGTNCGTDCSCD
jgi:hypothetical protein